MATIDAQVLREMIKQFRVLIIGRANAGKTSILHKVCNTTDEPEIYDTKGHKINAAVVESSIKRGNHDIRNEMVFKSNPGLVFHDSCGFEAGSEEEFEDMKNFISERANATRLEDRLHAIWYCIPMDDHCRTFQRSEEKFFSECDTGHSEFSGLFSYAFLGLNDPSSVPVIVVFTKFEALRPVAFGELKKQLKGASGEERSRRIAQRVEELFTNTGVLDRLCGPDNRARPKSHVRLANMDKPDTNCNLLLEHTTLALDNKELQLCLISTQQSNLELCIKCAVG
ncbi:GTP-binding protein [Suillus bovinus]|uniref:GTP-binding protein n=1 Tax=Suillus bovinus TaxID=48563 RepID=UPI001B86CA39|nr:GTP-binding protein [Suillus bovinus]KAG2159557.1 GTP-binding protein [Suillus bovinus]